MEQEKTIYYFVDVELGKTFNCTIQNIEKSKFDPDNTEMDYITFSNYKSITRKCFIVNPEFKNFFFSNTKLYGSKKCYLVFTDKLNADKALYEYVLPQMIEAEMQAAENVRGKYTEILTNIQILENKIKKGKAKLKKV